MHYTYRFRLIPRQNSVNCWIITGIPVGNSTTTHSTNSSKFPNRRVRLINGSATSSRDQLTSLKDWWDDLNDLYSTVAQAAVMRIEDSIKALSELKRTATTWAVSIGRPPRISVVSPTYSLASSSIVRTANPTVAVETCGYSPHQTPRNPHTDTVKEITVKKEPTGEWFASFTVGDKETP